MQQQIESENTLQQDIQCQCLFFMQLYFGSTKPYEGDLAH